mmetsp:Transcript_27068/g.49870  ORF Transcript_27068/g.49870 Transcript_27068/m.49870 type:complete len:567 (-) Transcript_27068:141-1841(-)
MAEDDDVDISATMESDSPAPLPTEEMDRRKSVEFERKSSYLRRGTTQSLVSFSSDSSVGSSDPSKIVEVGNLRFLNDNDMQDGQSSILGKGAFGTVRLARRRIPQRNASMVSGLSLSSEHITEPDCRGVKSSKDEGVLVAVKIFEKSLLEKCRTIERDKENQMQVRTALENVEREIAVMKMMQHPNLVSLYEVIDTGSNRLYMVLEYLPLGQILTNVQGTGVYKRRPMRNGEQKLAGVTPEGHFDEQHAALYFVDIMHGLAHLHKNHIVHRDLKPENILLDSRGFAKLGDFGVCHLFEDEMKIAERSSLNGSSLASNEEMSPARISRRQSDAALKMKSMSDMGKLTKTEGTWAFWSPEMCAENSLVFSGYTCDIWAAGICLYIFATGNLPFYTEIPLALFDMIAAANIKLDDANLSDALVDMLKKVLAKDPSARAAVGDCLKHPFCKDARNQRIKELGEEVETHEEVIVQNKDLRQAFSITKQNSLRYMASSVRSQFSSLRQRLSGSQTSQKSMSVDDDVDEMESGRRTRRERMSAPFLTFWRSQKSKMSMNEQDQGESGTNTAVA